MGYRTLDEVVAVIKTGDREKIRSLHTKRVVLFSDIDGFTKIVKDKGIEYFLLEVYEATQVLLPLLDGRGARLLKIDGDSFIILCDDVERGLGLILDYRERLASDPAAKELSVNWGIGYGDIIELENDAFGIELNLSAKIGEDVAKGGQILLTASAARELDSTKYQMTKHHQFGFDYYEVKV